MISAPLVSGSIQAQKGCLEADIVFLLDTSSSVRGYESFIAGALETFVDGVTLSPDGIKVGCISFTSLVTDEQSLTTEKDILYEWVDSLKARVAMGGTAMVPALGLAQSFFAESALVRGASVLRVIICISDGELGDWEDSQIWAHWLKSQGIVIFCVNVNEEGIEGTEILKQIASDPSHYVATDYPSLTATIQQMDMCM